MSERWTLHHGDCLDWLRTVESESVDSIVTDPPAGIAFMNKAWDHHKGGRAQWVAWLAEIMRECLRVLKPGGHALVWSIPRTEHWTACAVEDAGFEIRDGVYHLFAQGWPKSLDVSKAIDAAAGAEREMVGRKTYAGRGMRPVLPSTPTETYGVNRDPFRDTREVTAPVTDDARRWQGWGTALKPAVERWVLARKPLAGTVAENVLAHGTGALNIDGCRVPCDVRPARELGGETQRWGSYAAHTSSRAIGETTLGRWPANVVLSHAETCGDECDEACPVRELERQSGVLKSGSRSEGVRKGLGYHGAQGDGGPAIVGDEGGASRFFPVFHPFGYFGKAKRKSQRGGENRHPTVKHVDLMRWLVRLVTPKGGLVLDAFSGSGTTGVAALLEGMRFAGAEREDEYHALACKRLAAAELGETVVRTAEPVPRPAGRPQAEQPSLFGKDVDE